LVDSVLNLGLPAPIDIQIVGLNTKETHKLATQIAEEISELAGVSDVFIPQNIDAPALMLDVNREHASELGLSQREIVSNVITSLTSNLMIAPNYWVDPKTGNDYFLTIQYPEGYVKTLDDLKGIPIRASGSPLTARLDSVIEVKPTVSPTVVNHYQLQRVIDIYVASKTENLKTIGPQIRQIIDSTELPENVRINIRGSIEAMNQSFKSFGIGLLLSILLVYLILVAQFKSFIDPFIILLAVPPGLLGALATLVITGTTLNIMSLMGMVMLVGIAVSNSILILEFAHRLRREGLQVRDAVSTSCRVRLRPILMTSLATIIGLIPMGLALGAGSEAYASLARVVIGGLLISVILTVFLVPAAYVLIYGSKRIDTIDEEQAT
jgi:HAE1 family hydrophobic/amphiphilic exporter-1